MPISYESLFDLMKEKGFSSYRLRKEKLISQAVLQKLRTGGNVDTRTIEKLCAMLSCQPGDIMKYLPEKDGETK